MDAQNHRLVAVRRPALFKRFPKVRWVKPAQERIVPNDKRGPYGSLDEDLAIGDELVEPGYLDYDGRALEAQNTFRRGQVTLICLGLLVTILGAVQAALDGGVLWLGIVQAVFAGLAGWRAQALKRKTTMRDYFTLRKKAELLRGEYFLAVGKVGEYAELDLDARKDLVRQRVAAIEAAQ